jgi:biopolymer transport protein ExbB
MSRSTIVLIAAALAAQLGLTGAAQSATSLDELLQEVKNVRAKETELNAQREREFKANRDQQAKLLADAERSYKEAEARSTALSAQFDANSKEINDLDLLLKQRQGNLGELFGVTRQVAGDSANVLDQSMITAQYPDRVDFLRSLAGAKALPSITELERLWFEMQREMTETAKVIRYQGEVVQPDGSSQTQSITRVGPYTASSGGDFLAYLSSLKKMSRLPRPLPAEFTSAARDLEEAQGGYVKAVGDPGRGALIGLYVERPNWIERIEHGEAVNYIIIAVGVIGAVLALYQFLYLILVRLKVARQLRNLDNPTPDNPLGRVLLAFRGDPSRIEEDAEVAELRISEAVLHEVPALERFQAFLRLAVAAGPLLGLIGTVVGMIITFQSITESGSSDPKLMAHGIGAAMIATVLGLGIAIPLLFANAFLATLSRQVVQLLDEQSTGLLAESIEKRRGV